MAAPAMRRPAVSLGVYPQASLDSLLATARVLDGGVVDTLWIGDSPLIWHEVWTSIALCLTRTETLRFAPAVTNPKTRHWSVTAAAVQTLTEFAPGRIRLGIGVGDSALRRFAGKVATLDELEQAVGALRALLSRKTLPEPFADIRWDKRRADVEVVVSGSGPRTLERAGRLGDAAMIIPGLRRDYLDQVVAHVDAGAAAAGRDPAKVKKVLWVACSVGPDDAALDSVRPWVASVLRHPLGFTVDAATDRVREEIVARYDFGRHMSAASHHGARLPAETVRDFALAGSVAAVSDRLQEVFTMPVDEVVLVLMGDDPPTQAGVVLEAVDGALLSGRPT